ncbi:MAG: type II secretion system protein M [Spongiibacteraceae bacterium]|nr:type II secretion system protein M [Spongiibacteraceae bacterium]
MQEWFEHLKRQEQLMLLIGGSLVVIYLFIVVLWQPMVESSELLEVKNNTARESLQNVKQLAAKYKQLEKSGKKKSGSSGTSLTRLIDQSVKKNELYMKRFQPSSSGDVQVRFENAVFNNVIAWLSQLENEHSVFIKDLSVSPGNGSGLVNVSVRLRQGAK